MNWHDQVVQPDNLYWAWNKVGNFFRLGDTWRDLRDIAEFEANLDGELKKIRMDFENLNYTTSPLRPIPHPKKAKSTKEPAVRQMFWVKVRDQVAWVALVNVLGSELDSQMPSWSYGNRLYRPVWYDESDHFKQLRRGPYRNSSGRLYRAFKHTWPLYRRHIALTIREAAKIQELPNDEAELSILQTEQSLSEQARLPYLLPDWWEGTSNMLFRAHIDLRKFYPSINIDQLLTNFRLFCPKLDEPALNLVKQLLRFPLDTTGWSRKNLETIGLNEEQSHCKGLPTGLFVAGFLSNVAMLGIDQQVGNKVRQKQVAHFRYVDDHVFLAKSVDSLLEWVNYYSQLIHDSGLGIDINGDKTDPPCLRKHVKKLGPNQYIPVEGLLNKKGVRASIEKETIIDPKFPTPLVTAILARMSDVAHTLFVLLDQNGQDAVLQELEFLLNAQLPDDEIKDETRVSFAAGRLATLAPKRTQFLPLEQRQPFLKRIFSLLLRAIHTHPDKLPLWSRMLDYCRRTCHLQMEPLLNELRHLSEKQQLSASYIRAYFVQLAIAQLFRCLFTITDKNEFQDTRVATIQVLKCVIDLHDSEARTDKSWCETASEQAFAFAVIGAKMVLIECYHNDSTHQDLRTAIGQIVEEETSSSLIEKMKDAAGGATSLWVWWLDQMTVPKLATHAGTIWTLFADLLDENDQMSLIIWTRNPDELPQRVIRWLFSDSFQIQRIDMAWIYEAYRGAIRRNLSLRNLNLGEVAFIEALSHLDESLITLDEWADWTSETYKANPYDPRTGEWTALQIVSKLVHHESDRISDGSYIHPANFLVPKKWTREQPATLTWESWSSELNDGNASFPSIRNGTLLQDHRFVMTDFDEDVADRKWSIVQGYGMLLLGLLSKTFRRPSLWNNDGYALATPFPVRVLIHQLQISSWTGALLEAALMPRSRETLLIDAFISQLRSKLGVSTLAIADDDTTNDPPRISTIADLTTYIDKAMTVLKDFQLMVQGSMPRQLVPRRLGQLKPVDWQNGAEEETEQ